MWMSARWGRVPNRTAILKHHVPFGTRPRRLRTSRRKIIKNHVEKRNRTLTMSKNSKLPGKPLRLATCYCRRIMLDRKISPKIWALFIGALLFVVAVSVGAARIGWLPGRVVSLTNGQILLEAEKYLDGVEDCTIIRMHPDPYGRIKCTEGQIARAFSFARNLREPYPGTPWREDPRAPARR
jgi:hypothetical protein